MAAGGLPADVRVAIQAPHRRPLLHHLNADTSWLIQVPIPTSARTNRAYFNILLDPWLSGQQSDVASWFSRQWHADEPVYSSIAAVEELCQTVENEYKSAQGSDQITHSLLIDAVAISHEFTDHCHKQTLCQLNREVPIIAAVEAIKVIRKWNHFKNVISMPNLTSKIKSWQQVCAPSLPKWLTIARLQNEKDGLYYHSAMAVIFDLEADVGASEKSPAPASSAAECIIYTPHGAHPPTLEPLVNIAPAPQPLVLIHGLHDIWLDWRQQLNLGAHNGLQAQRLLGAKYWVGTHDEIKHGRGVVSWFLRRKQISISEAIEKEQRKNTKLEKLDAVSYHEMANGESLVLEKATE